VADGADALVGGLREVAVPLHTAGALLVGEGALVQRRDDGHGSAEGAVAKLDVLLEQSPVGSGRVQVTELHAPRRAVVRHALPTAQVLAGTTERVGGPCAAE
jgi:hypothetical protein